MHFDIREVPFLSMGGVYEKDDIDAVLRVVREASEPAGNFFPMPEEGEFQEAFAAHEGARRAVVVNSCGTALDLCMMALGVGPGDEVIVPPLTFIATATCVIARGARVVFADVDSRTLCMDSSDARKRITSRTKAIIPVHFAGLAADIDGFEALRSEAGIPIVYDAAHAVSAKFHGQPVGGRGDISCYSFQSNKNMTTLGEGGAITTDNEEIAELIRRKKSFGYIYGPKLRIADIGFNYRMTKPQCAAGLTQLGKVDRVVAQRLRVFQYMDSLLQGVSEIVRPADLESGHACHLYVARLDSEKVRFTRDAFLDLLKRRYRVACGLHYPALWNWEAIAELGYCEEKAACPIAAQICKQVFSIPLFPSTTELDCNYITWALKQALVEARGGN